MTPRMGARRAAAWVVALTLGFGLESLSAGQLTIGDRVVVWLDTVAGRGSQSPHWTPADSVWTSLRPQERLPYASYSLALSPLPGAAR